MFEEGEAKQVIEDYLADVPEAQELENNVSRFAYWAFVKNALDLLMVQLSTMFMTHKQEVEELIQQDDFINLAWYENNMKGYQFGDSAIVTNNRIGYAITDEDKQIIKFVSAKEIEETVDGNTKYTVLIKVAKEENGAIAQLNTDEYSGANSYLRDFKVPGTSVRLETSEADKVSYTIDIERNPQILDADLKRIDGTDNTPIITALKAYHDDKNRNDFNTTLYLSRVTDALQAVEGVVDVEITEARYFDGTSFVPFSRKWEGNAGYEELDVDSLIINVV